MKEIKFRLVKDGKIVGYEKHTQNKGNFKSSIFHSVKDDCDLGYEWNNIVCLSERVIDCDYKEQYTGLKDKNGKEIYEGDKFDINGKIMFVEYVEDHGRYVLTTGNGYDTRNCVDLDCDIVYGKEIIGNIHEEIL